MKKAKKGFTLIELLIVITILGALAAAMATTSGNATARAKAASIVANVEACKTAAAIYYADNWDSTTIATATAAQFLYDTTAVEGAKKYVPNFKDFSTGNITYTVDTAEANGSGKGRDNWGVVVSFANDAEAANVQKELVKAKGYSAVVANKTGFTVNLTTGEIKNITPE